MFTNKRTEIVELHEAGAFVGKFREWRSPVRHDTTYRALVSHSSIEGDALVLYSRSLFEISNPKGYATDRSISGQSEEIAMIPLSGNHVLERVNGQIYIAHEAGASVHLS